MSDQSFKKSDGPTTIDNVVEFSVGEISQAIKQTLEGAFDRVRIRGEVGKPNYHGSGHLYFTLKDAEAAMDAVAWRGTVNKMKLRLEEGMEVIITGRISSYAKSSRYQVVVESAELAGEGALLKLLEERRKKLAAEGLFDRALKKELPFLPDVIGVITSPTGAVIRDILNRLEDRFPRKVLLWPVPVQGDGAAQKIAEAIQGFNSIQPNLNVTKPDVLIVARGGGSLEDLWQFNEEVVVRAVFESNIPLISAVGHETDTTLIDFVADLRASTPTAAAELSVPVRNELLAQVLDNGGRLVRGMERLMESGRTRIEGLARGLPRSDALLETATQSLDFYSERLNASLFGQIERATARVSTASASMRRPQDVIELKSKDITQICQSLTASLHSFIRDRVTYFEALSANRRMLADVNLTLRTSASALDSMSQLLNSVSYERVLERGFVLVRNKEGNPVLLASSTTPGQDISIHFSDAKVTATISDDKISQGSKKRNFLKRKTKSGSSNASSGQGSLF